MGKYFARIFLFIAFLAGVIFVPGPFSPEAETTPAVFAKAFQGFYFKPKFSFIEKEVVVTAYSPPLFPYGSPTFSGKPVKRGVVAVDPKVIPLGSDVFLPTMFPGQKFLALDTGSKVKGDHIDIWLPTEKAALKFGRQKGILAKIKIP
ncbi:3D domain-containing protein [Candidatus Parcubacteria bacterium]|nr:3D domain-containing protein [Candidatus Parcubacteria bacterium]